MKMWVWMSRCLIGWAIFALSAEGVCGDDDIRRSVVKIEVTEVGPDIYEPWKREQPSESAGTGVIIEGNRILTNAHVVSHARSITVQAFQSATKVPARLVASAVGIDLAVLEVEDEDDNDLFFEDRPPLPFDRRLPVARSTVNAYGFPFGGTQISVTEGIVSRVEFARYYLSASGLRIQIDAALNPGNSGGPAVKDGKLVGLVFSRISEGDNVGYLIPVEEIELFLSDIEDGTYDGKLILAEPIQTLENRVIRRKLGLGEDVGGVMLTNLDLQDDPSSTLGKWLRPWDVITAVDGQPIDREGKVKLGDDNRVDFAYLIQKHADDDTVELTVLREGKQIELKVDLSRGYNWLAPALGNAYPRYFIAGPMVFTPVTSELVRGLSASRRWSNFLISRQSPLLLNAFQKRAAQSDREMVVATGFLPHSITQGYTEPAFGVVAKLNGVPIEHLSHLVELIRDSQDKHLVFEFADHGMEVLVFDRTKFLRVTEEVLEDNGIRRQASKELLKVWEAGQSGDPND